MPKPLSYRKLLTKLKRAGCAGPFFGAKHQFMRCDGMKLYIPNPHGADIGPEILKRIIFHVGITEDKFEEL